MDRWLRRATSLAALVVMSAGCSLVTDFDKSLVDASTDASARCTLFEPNEDLASAAPLTPSTQELGICDPTDVDFFSFSTVAGDDVIITLTHPDAGQGGDLDLRLFVEGNTVAFDSSVSAGTQELISRTSAAMNQLAAGNYIIGVEGFNGATNTYSLTLTINAAPPADAGPDSNADAMP